MTLRPPLYVANGSAGVTAPQDARLAQAGLIIGEPGVLAGGGSVTGSTSGPNMQYIVPAEVFAAVRGTLAADGAYLLANDGNVTVNSATPAPGSGTRWDLIYVRALNANDGFGDANSTPVFGVQVGTSGGSPTKPYGSVPAGALVLAESLVGTSIANASLATITQVNGWVTALGGTVPVATAALRDALTPRYKGLTVYRLDDNLAEVCTDPVAPTWGLAGAVELGYNESVANQNLSTTANNTTIILATVSVTLATARKVRLDGLVYITPNASSTSGGAFQSAIFVDGVQVGQSTTNIVHQGLSASFAQTHRPGARVTLSAAAHTITLRAWRTTAGTGGQNDLANPSTLHVMAVG